MQTLDDKSWQRFLADNIYVCTLENLSSFAEAFCSRSIGVVDEMWQTKSQLKLNSFWYPHILWRMYIICWTGLTRPYQLWLGRQYDRRIVAGVQCWYADHLQWFLAHGSVVMLVVCTSWNIGNLEFHSRFFILWTCVSWISLDFQSLVHEIYKEWASTGCPKMLAVVGSSTRKWMVFAWILFPLANEIAQECCPFWNCQVILLGKDTANGCGEGT